MKVRIFNIISQVYITPYVKVTYNRHLNGNLELILGWVKWEIVIKIN